MSRAVTGFLCAFLSVAVYVFADTPEPTYVIDKIVERDNSRSNVRGFCSVVHHDAVSNDYWDWPRSQAGGDEIGVLFDLPNDCGKLPGEECSCITFRWYWVQPQHCERAYFVYHMYEVDESANKVGDPIGEPLAVYSFIDGWNSYTGFGPTTADRVVITATMQGDLSTPPPIRTDNNVGNLRSGRSSIPTETRSYYYRWFSSDYSPPLPAEDSFGPVNFLMDATFNCEVATSTETASWGSIKSLFR